MLLFAGNPADLLDTLKTFVFQGILSATVSVDTFFLLGYVLQQTFHLWFNQLLKYRVHCFVVEWLTVFLYCIVAN